MLYFYNALNEGTSQGNKFFFIICVFRIVSPDTILFLFFIVQEKVDKIRISDGAILLVAFEKKVIRKAEKVVEKALVFSDEHFLIHPVPLHSRRIIPDHIFHKLRIVLYNKIEKAFKRKVFCTVAQFFITGSGSYQVSDEIGFLFPGKTELMGAFMSGGKRNKCGRQLRIVL